MKRTIIYSIKLIMASSLALLVSSCNSFLDLEPLDNFNDANYWSSEANVRTFSWRFYNQFMGYGKGVGTTAEFYYQGAGAASCANFSDDLIANTLLVFQRNPSSSNSTWNSCFSYIARANIMLERLPLVPEMNETDANHWEGFALFFRAYNYFMLVQRFGDVPYYDFEYTDPHDNQTTFLPRTDRNVVMDHVLADLDKAITLLKDRDVSSNLIVKDVALALKSRACLYEGTYHKYHTKNTERSKKYLEEAKKSANTIIAGKKYTLANTFKEVYNSEDLSKNTEIIFFKPYVSGIQTHSLQAFNFTSTTINGMSKWGMSHYVCTDGLPIAQSSKYQGDLSLDEVLADRDPRLVAATETKDISYRGMEHRDPGLQARNSTSGYVFALYNNPESTNVTTTGQNSTDAPIFGYAEVLLNYAEACAELGSITDGDLDKSINLLRERVELPKLTVVGEDAYAGGVKIDDPARVDAIETKSGVVSSILWEIRRERRVELMGWNEIRYYDLMRWKKGIYLDFDENPDALVGIYLGEIPTFIKDGVEKAENIVLDKDGYLQAYGKLGETGLRKFDEGKNYLNSIPTGQIDLYEREGVSFPQNKGW